MDHLFESSDISVAMELLAWVDAQQGIGKKHPIIPRMLPMAKRVIELLQAKFPSYWLPAFAIIEEDAKRAKLIAQARWEVDEGYADRLSQKLSDPSFVDSVKKQVARNAADRKNALEAARQQERDDRETELREAEKRAYQQGLMEGTGLKNIDPAEIDPDFRKPTGDVFEYALKLGAAVGLAGRRLLDDDEVSALTECRMQRETAAILARRAKTEPPRKLLAAAIPATLYYRLEEPVIARMLGFPTKWLSALPRLIEQVAHLLGLDSQEFRRRIEAGDPPAGWADLMDQTAASTAA